MAKKNDVYNPYADRTEQIRKAKGNPNKNLHAKKSGSNYGGYRAAEQRAARAQKADEKIKLPTWMIVTLAVLFGLLVAALILRTTVLKENVLTTHITSILVGVVCAFLFYTRRWRTERQPELNTTIYKIITVALCIFAVLYAGIGIMGVSAVLA